MQTETNKQTDKQTVRHRHRHKCLAVGQFSNPKSLFKPPLTHGEQKKILILKFDLNVNLVTTVVAEQNKDKR